jgi:hypothetical protein
LKNKAKPGSGSIEIVKFFFNVFVMIPFFFIVCLPLTIVFKVLSMIQGRKKLRKPEYLEVSDIAKDKKAL